MTERVPANLLKPLADLGKGFARRSRVLLLRHKESAIDIDVILGGLSFEKDAVAQGRTYSVGGINVRLPRVEDLLIMKAVAQQTAGLAGHRRAA